MNTAVNKLIELAKQSNKSVMVERITPALLRQMAEWSIIKCDADSELELDLERDVLPEFLYAVENEVNKLDDYADFVVDTIEDADPEGVLIPESWNKKLPYYQLKEFLEANGIIGYTEDILKAVSGIYRVVLETDLSY